MDDRDELKQLYNKSTFNLVCSEHMMERDKDEDIKSLLSLKEKRDGRVNGRTCNDG